MKERYEPAAIEAKWQERWEREQLFRAGRRRDKPRKYVLEMFPYPSGDMHMGHVRNYLIGDVIARIHLTKGFDVLHPMGWDSLGLPAENAAIRDKRHPAERTAENIRTFKEEMRMLGLSYDWSREINTADPETYKWSQWFFLKFRERGLVYRRFAQVNWCPGCKTALANEQVKDGLCERSGDVVEKRRMPEWAMRITNYSERLLQGIDTLTEWPEEVRKKQRNWIGKSEGASLFFQVEGAGLERIEVFTTRADTIFGCTYAVVAPDHPILERIVPAERREAVEAFAREQARKAAGKSHTEELPKEGIDTGARVIHPFTGEKLPLWAANFVVADYGTGAVMSVPAHDERDFDFARTYGLPIRPVIAPEEGELPATLEAAFTEDGVLIESADYTGMRSAEAREAIAKAAAAGGFGGPTVSYRQRDWGISRQRYWGTPIPIVYCKRCDPEGEGIAVPYEELPVRIPPINVAEVLTGAGEPPLAKVPEFVNTTCPSCGGPARREVETMDTFVDSSWYFARYLDPENDELPFTRARADEWLPVDVYIGGPEHSTMHLLYFRFWTMVMQEMGLCAEPEPVKRLINQGIVNGPDGRKMSKRWGNVAGAREICEKYGADAARTFVMFAGPPDKDIDWSNEQVEGCARFLQRVWRLARQNHGGASARHEGAFEGKALEIRRAAHRTLHRVREDLDRLSVNTAVARMMELVNVLLPMKPESEAEKAAMSEAVRLLAAMLSPIAPHIAEEILEAYGARDSILETGWPAADPSLLVEERRRYVIQVNGKLRGEVEVAAAAGEDEVRQAAEADEKVRPHLEGKTIRKVIFVKNRLMNFVVS